MDNVAEVVGLTIMIVGIVGTVVGVIGIITGFRLPYPRD